MFEAIVSLCLATEPWVCRDVLVPGHQATTMAECAATLSGGVLEIDGLKQAGAPICAPVGLVLDFVEVAPGLFVHRGQIAEPDAGNGGDVSNIAFVVGRDSVAVIDAGSAAWVAEGVWRAIRMRTDLPVSHLILTHMHPDHVLGAAVFARAGAELIGHAGLERALADRRENYRQSLASLIGVAQFIGSDTARIGLEVAESAKIDLGGRMLDLLAWQNAHTGTDLTVLDRESGIMLTGDLVFDQHTPALDGSVTGWQAVLAEMATLPVTRIVPGHGGPVLDWPEAGEPMLRYLGVLATDTRNAIAEGQRLGDAAKTIAESESTHWQLFDAYNRRNATVAFTELEWE
ncbi:quinoprotein relay system zinc metallohydrolase 2 [Puniceibacterium sp. IMCC21224]|uniref:quinoprotein relay system zinc metallohydrolase 2 n=1 Tax=Puniceibacterium sp. IMCC21224 TaxID=1618204 RepID=UPI00064D8293|nr:quinoprotein relay system zinc metallohydrolase 2 [Puniceibacterium sp. IMCC21224]KMK65471.1 Zn-dependent hydrolase, glyoxylase [Puniceibacterium sp. IMCC21224]